VFSTNSVSKVRRNCSAVTVLQSQKLLGERYKSHARTHAFANRMLRRIFGRKKKLLNEAREICIKKVLLLSKHY
jgi:hypothetical protein